MKSCTHCIHAIWDKTKTGRLSPTGDGRCGKKLKPPKLPAAFFWFSAPKPVGGHINRREDLKEHCAFYDGGSHE